MRKLKTFFGFTAKIAFLLLLVTALAGTSIAANLVGEAAGSLPAWNKQSFQAKPSATLLYDCRGQVITELHGKINRIPVKLEQLPQVMQDAIVSTEDERFYDHRGIDYWGLGRALLNDFQGRSQEGASTITQQLVKNVLLSPEKSLSRKIREAILARQVETAFSKREILETYLNLIYFGEGAYGVEAASQTYFGKPCSELTLPEAALLAGLPKNPSRYSPFADAREARERRNTVLQVMCRNGYISQRELQAGQGAPLPEKRNARQDSYPYPYFLDHVIDELINKYGFSQEQVYDGGLRVYTTLDPQVQQALEEVYNDPANFPPSSGTRLPESAMVILQQSSGEVKGLVGGRSHVVRRGYNRATMLKRQPGSTFKPLVVYAPAIELGYGPATVLDDKVEVYGKDSYAYAPENMGSFTRGRISMRTALNNSVNTYAVKLLKMIGVNQGYDFGKRLGLLSLNSQDKVLGLALGGTTQGLSPLELASAYAPLANRGIKVQTHSITRVLDSQAKVLAEEKPVGRPVMKTETADMITDLLKSAVDRGTGKQARLQGRPVAGKTGTTELPGLPEFSRIKQGNKDAWFAGYTPELVGVVWLGYDITDANHYLKKVYGGSYPAEIWNKVFSRVLAGSPPVKFAPAPAAMLAAERKIFPSKPKSYPVSKSHPVNAGPALPSEPPSPVQVSPPADRPPQSEPPTQAGGGILGRLLNFLQRNQEQRNQE